MRSKFVLVALLCVLAFPAAATQGTGACGNTFIAPAVNALALTAADDGTLISPANATGPADGWAAASLPVTLPDLSTLSGNPWTVCGTSDNNAAVVFIPPLLAAPAQPALSQTAGGSLPGRTYFVQVTYTNITGETSLSAEATVAVGINNRLVVDGPSSVGSPTGWNVYVGTSTSNKTKQNATPMTLGANFTEPLGGLIVGALPPASNTASSAYIIDGGRVLGRYLVGGTNYQTATLSSDGTNYRVINASNETRMIAGATTGFPARYGFPSGPGYQTTQGDNGTAITSGATSGGLTVTLPPTTSIATGWTVRFDRDAGRDITVNTNGTSGGAIVFPNGSTTSLALAPVNSESVTLQYDGAVFRALNISTSTATLIGVSGVLGHVPNTAKLKLAKGTPGSSIFRDGFYNSGDGGGAKYNWSIGNCSAADDGAQVQPTSVTGCWIADFSVTRQTPNVWGCKGDGTTNDTSCMQAAIAAAQGTGIQLYIGSGLYKITASLSPTAPLLLTGGGGPGQYVDTCVSGLRMGTLNMSLLIATTQVTIDRVCIDATGLSMSGGAAISIFGQANASIVSNSQINGSCIGVELSGTIALGQNVDTTINNNTIRPANSTGCVGIRVGNFSVGGNTVDIKVIENKIYCGAGGGLQTGVEIRDAGGAFFDNVPPFACNIGTKFDPGVIGSAGQVAGFSFFTGGLGDTSTTNDLLISPSDVNGSVWHNTFTGTWAATSSGGPSIKIENPLKGTVNAVHFSNHRSINNTGATAVVDISAGVDVTFDGGQICGLLPTKGIYIHGDAGTLTPSPNQIAVRGVTIGGCDLGVNVLSTGIDIEPGTPAFHGIFTNNNLIYDNVPMVYSPTDALNSSPVINNNDGLDAIQQQINTSSATVTLGVSPLAKINDPTPISVLNGFWGGRQILLTAGNAAGMSFVTGGNIANAVTIAQNQSVLATYVGGTGWFLK